MRKGWVYNHKRYHTRTDNELMGTYIRGRFWKAPTDAPTHAPYPSQRPRGFVCNNNNINNNNNIYLLQLGCHPVAVDILHVYKI